MTSSLIPYPPFPQAALSNREQGNGSRLNMQPAFKPSQATVFSDIQALGTGVRLSKSGLVLFNEPLVQRIAGYGTGAISPLAQKISSADSLNGLIEGLYTAQKLAESGVRNLDPLYAAASQYNSSSNTLVLIYLAGFYRALNEPASFGPMLSALLNPATPAYAKEELGGTVLQLIANRSADETMKRLLPAPSTQTLQNPVTLPIPLLGMNRLA